MNKRSILLPFAFCLLPLLLVSCGTATQYGQLTQCLNDKQVVMFGASWCPHCADQKALFGRSVSNLPYFECSKNGTQVAECDARKIMSYPTWQFQESTLQTLPAEALTSLFNGELEKVRSTAKSYKTSTKATADDLKFIAACEAKTDALVASDIPEFEKLKKLMVISEDEKGLIEVPVYISGRIAGERPLADIALYSGCSAAYQADMTAATTK